MNIYKEKNQAENLKANARTQQAINSGKTEIDISIAESIHSLVNQVALYRGINRASAEKIVSQLLRGYQNEHG